jgi:hypothetical protein
VIVEKQWSEAIISLSAAVADNPLGRLCLYTTLQVEGQGPHEKAFVDAKNLKTASLIQDKLRARLQGKVSLSFECGIL